MAAIRSLIIFLMLTGPVAAADNGDPTYADSASVLVKLFMLALLLESALAVIFRWRVFIAVFDGRGWKTLIMIGLSWLVVSTFKIGWVGTLLKGYGAAIDDASVLPAILTTLVLAGGSSGIYNLLVRLGYRAPMTEAETRPTPPQDKAWLAIKVIRRSAQGDIRIHLDKATPQPDPMPPAIAGVVGGSSAFGDVRGLFFRDRMRFPRSAGYVVEPGVAYRLGVAATDGTASIPSAIDDVYVFARGTIVDLTVTL